MVHPTGPRPPRPWVLFVWVTLAAMAVRAVYILQISDPALNPFFAHPILDAAVHRRWALGILDGTWPPSEPFFRAPLYPYVLAGLYRVFGADNALAVQLVHGLVSAVGAGLAGLCARAIWGNRAGWFAGMGFAVLWPSIFFAGELLDVTLGVTLNLLLWWILLGDPTRLRLAGAGFVWGLAVISRPLVLAIAPVVVLYLLRRGLGRRSLGWVALAGGLAAAVLPVTARNVIEGGEPVAVAASGGVNFYIGNNEHADGRVAFLPGAAVDWQGEVSEVRDLAYRETGRRYTAQGADRYFLGKGLAFLWHNPRRALGLYAHKLGLLFAAGERSNNKNLPFWRARSPLLRWPVWVGWGPVLVLAFLGLRRRDTTSEDRLLLVGSLVLYAAALLLFFINARFRLPLLAWLMVPAGGGADRLVRAVRLGDWNPRFRWGVVVAAAALLAVWIPDEVGFRQDPANDFESWRILGDGFERGGDLPRAAASYRTTLDISRRRPRPEFSSLVPAVHMRLGGIFLREQDPRAALPEFKAASDLTGDVGAEFGVGMCLLQMERWSSAEDVFKRVIRRRPDQWQAYGNLAICYEQTGRPTEAQETWRKVLALNPDDAMARRRLGLRR